MFSGRLRKPPWLQLAFYSIMHLEQSLVELELGLAGLYRDLTGISGCRPGHYHARAMPGRLDWLAEMLMRVRNVYNDHDGSRACEGDMNAASRS